MIKIRIRVNKTKKNNLELNNIKRKKIRIRVDKTKLNNLQLTTNSKKLLGKSTTAILVTWILIAGFAFSVSFFGTNAYFSDTETANNCSLTANVSKYSWHSPPDKPTVIAPENNIKGMNLNPILTVHVIDPNNDIMDVYFYNAADNILIDTVTNVENNTIASVVWNGLDYGATYEWYVIAKDHEGPTQSDTWRFTTNYPPDMASLISPMNSLLDAELSQVLKVQVFDPDENNMDVSFYDASDNSQIGSIQTDIPDGGTASVTWDNLDYSHTYSWYVIVNDSMTETKSNTWYFTTMPHPPVSSSPPSNNPPIADPGGPYTGYANQEITFNGTGCTDDGIITSYLWDFGDNQNGTGMYPVHNYTFIGTYNITLTVTDDGGLTDTNTTNITITSILEINDVTATPNPQNTDGNVNITCTLTNTSKIVDVTLNITHPDNSKINISMVHTDGAITYYYDSVYSDIGDYTFFIHATDISNNIVTSNIYHFSIADLQPPTIIDNTPETAYTNQSFTFNATVTDNIIVAEVYVEYWYETGNHTNLSMNNIDDNYWNKTITIQSNFTILHYIVYARDTSNNWSYTEIKNITLL